MAIERSQVEKFLQRDKYKYEGTRHPGEKEGGSNDPVWIDKTKSYELAQAIATALNNNLKDDEICDIISHDRLEEIIIILEDCLHGITSNAGRLTRIDWNYKSNEMLAFFKKIDLPNFKSKVK